MIRASAVFHHFGLRPTLKDVSLTVEAGRTLAIIGPNGSGKTTLLNVMAGQTAPSEGTVAINGLVRRSSMECEQAIRQQTIFLPAEAWLPGDMTGRDYVLGVGEVWGVPARRLFDHADQLFRVFQVDHIADSIASGYSTGQRKKIALCSALISEASVLLLDEPFSGGLDPAGLTAMKQILKHLTAREDKTVVLTSPVPELVEEVADDVLILQDGSVLTHDTVAGIRNKAEAETLDEALRSLIFPQTASELAEYFAREAAS